MNGKQIDIHEHEDGRRDVTIGVSRLDLDPGADVAPDTKAAAEDILRRLADQPVMVVVIHKPSNHEAHHIVRVRDIQPWARAAILQYNRSVCRNGIEAPLSEFVAVAHFLTSNEIHLISIEE